MAASQWLSTFSTAEHERSVSVSFENPRRVIMAETTSPEGGADILPPATQPTSAETAPSQTIILGLPDDQSIRPFSYHASEQELEDLNRRILATRWPERETVADASQGVNLATMRKLADY